nr:glycosyltransferase [Candidatus Levybacteria bacterium]
MQAFNKKISVIIPTLNEEKNIPELIKRLDTSLTKGGFTYELIFVDDNSTDNTRQVIESHSKTHPVSLYIKKGKKGKAYSISEGITYAKHPHIGIIDADLQYPPEDIASMAQKLESSDVVVAKRTQYQASRSRKFLSRSFKYVFGKLLFSLPHDIQAGMKVFKKEVIETIEFKPVSGWTFDLEFLHRASHAGYKITDHPITFEKRRDGKSKVRFLTTSAEIGLNAVSVKLKRIHPQPILSKNATSMLGAGIGHKRKRYITHTTLHHDKSAIRTFLLKQKLFIGFVLALIVYGLFTNFLVTLQILVATLSVIYFLDVLFNLLMVLRSLHFPQEISVADSRLQELKDSELPVYTILCPMYKEGHILPKFLESISNLDYPKNKLDVILLLEEDDLNSQKAARNLNLPSFVRVAVVPQSIPKTKPKACNYGLSLARGEYLVIYDAEDIPDPLQLKKAYLAFQTAPKNVKCLQAKLNYHNPNQNLLTRFFTAEYSLWFDVTLTGYQSLNTSIPLGGTSNHFKTQDLLDLEGWDPFNVTEDADLGTRLFKAGFLTAVIDSVTLEEANSKWGNWVRQRSRWIKGYMQTYLVHMRNPLYFTKKKGHHMLFFNLIVGGKIAFILINPFLWLATFAYFALYAYVGPSIEKLYPTYVFYMAVFSLVFGNFLYLFYYMIGTLKREQYGLIKYVFFVPIYWFMISVAGFYAFYQLLFKPHYWEKTTHGLDIKKLKVDYVADVATGLEKSTTQTVTSSVEKKRFYKNISANHIFGMMLIGGMAAGSVFNFLYNAYLGRVLSLEDFALIGLFSSLLSILWIASGILGKTVTLQASYLIGKSGEHAAFQFWKGIRFKVFVASFVLAVAWVVFSPFIGQFLRVESQIPLLLFTPVILLGLLLFVNTGFLSARLKFGSLAFLAVFETAIKFSIAVTLVLAGFGAFAYAAIPFSITLVFIAAAILVRTGKKAQPKTDITDSKKFPKSFFLISVLTGIATIAFLNIDVILAKHYLNPGDAGLYALTALIGKMILFLAGLVSPFIIPLVSRNEGAQKDSGRILNFTILGTLALSVPSAIAFMLYGDIIIPFLFGDKSYAVLPFIPLIAVAMVSFAAARVYADYYLAKKYYTFTAVAVVFSVIEVVMLSIFHSSIWAFVLTMCFTWISYSATILLLHALSPQVKIVENNIADFAGLFGKFKSQRTHKNKRILVLNWRDTRHK